MIRSAVGVVLFFYFLGSSAMAPIRPPVIAGPLVAFHHEVNSGVRRIFSVPVKATLNYFGGPVEEDIPLRPTIAPGDKASDEI